MKLSVRMVAGGVALLALLVQPVAGTRADDGRAHERVKTGGALELRGAAALEPSVAVVAPPPPAQRPEEGAPAAAAPVEGAPQRAKLWRRVRMASFPVLTLLRRGREQPPQAGGGEAPPQTGEEEEEEADANAVMVSFLTWLIGQAVYLVLAAAFAYLYKANKEWLLGQELIKPSEKNFKEWTSPCIEPILFWSCLCPGVRWADSMEMTGIVSSFWTAFLMFFAVCVVSGLTPLLSLLIMTPFMTYFRYKLREKFEMEQNVCRDFVGYCCCLPCLVAQEARHVEDAQLAKVL
mmetsp:Transcript_68562/g.189771  ORF Transcript_68562/g.189771 Transcript_68562/m.189771 type:complete len:292 (+) Transcript_68562:82-957(+)|eukprot:CAMPEP_0179163522 /NCGR_PEP_ID=MMETSP0796-20121207/80188_1 /TAXON_ID=73915 /ORGANISM="Pyrodinium bahamense, Strain pbaha01" /LENGTH=291 /DNA_ID=CAMNT_0020865865 /DNA_START=19 /DNA_END=894 /DNA_ORIENTATION=+